MFVVSIYTLLLGIGIVLLGAGMLSTLLGVRASLSGFNPLSAGIIMSGYFVGYIIGTYQCPRLIRRFRHIRVYASMAALGSITALLHGLFVNPWIWGGLRILSGICMVGLYMVIESWLNEQSPTHVRGKVFSVYMAVTLMAMAMGQFLILADDITALTLFALASMLFSLGLVPVTLTRVREPESVPSAHLGLKHLHEVAPLAVAGALISGVCASALLGMGPVFAHRVGLSTAATALFMSITILGGAVLQWPVGHLSDTRDRRKILAATSFAAALSASGIYFAILYLPAAAYAGGFVCGGLLFSLYALSAAHMNDHLRREEVLEATGGLLLVYGVGAALGPALAGLFMDTFRPGTLLFFFSTALTILGCYAVYLIRRDDDIPTEAQEPFVSMTRTTPAALEMYPRTEARPELDETPDGSSSAATGETRA